MARLPEPGEADWGTILNAYLLTSHDKHGHIQPNSVTESHLDSKTRAKLNAVEALARDPRTAALLAGGAGASTGSNRIRLAAATTYVNSVNGRYGVVTLTSSDVGLANVNNTSDVNKPISTATQTALNAKAATSHTHTSAQITDATATGKALLVASSATVARTAIGAGTSNLVIGTTATTAKAGDYTPTKATVGLANVDDTSDVNKPISTATQTALNAKANDNGVVHNANDEIITGVKNFTTGLQSGGQAVVTTGDSRLNDQRTPLDSSVTAAKLATGGASSGQVLSYDGNGLAWSTITASGGVISNPADATTTSKGVVQLAGDLSGNASAPTVPGLATKEPVLTAGTSAQYYRGDKTWQTLDKSSVGLSYVNNTSDLDKPVSTATQAAIAASAGSNGAKLLLINNSAALPAGTPPGVVVVVKGLVS